MGIDNGLGFVRRARRDPVWWAKTVLGVDLWWKQVEMIESVRDFVRTAVKACHAPGKTFTAATTALWFLHSFSPAYVLVTAPTWNQVHEVLFPEIRSLHKNALYELGGRFLKNPPKLQLDDKWYLLGLSPKEPESFAGWHNRHILIICDEASGIPKKIMEAIRGVMMSGSVRLLLLGNPTKPEGALYDAFNKSRHMYNPISIGAFDTPNLKPLIPLLDACKNQKEKLAVLRSAPIVNPHLINAAAVADMLEEFGEDSQIYRVRVLGEFPSSAPDQLIDLWLLEEAVHRWENMEPEMRWWENLPRWDRQILGGFDPSRYGDNRTSLAAQSDHIWAPLESYDRTDTIFAAARAADFYQRHRCDEMRVDEHGLGGGPLDLLLANPRVNVRGITVGSSAMDPVTFGNLRAEAYWGMRMLAKRGELWLPRNDRLIGQLSTIKYKHKPTGEMYMESKEDMKERNVGSPDEADAVVLSMLTDGGNVTARSVGTRTNWEGMHG